MPAALPGTIMTKQQKFEALLADPGAFYDNRADKRNPRAPDFKHKTDSQLVIWLDDTDQATQATIHNIFGVSLPQQDGNALGCMLSRLGTHCRAGLQLQARTWAELPRML